MYHDGIRVHGFLVPDALVDFIRREDSARILDKELYDFELHGRQLHWFPVYAYLYGVLVQLQAADGVDMIFVSVFFQGGQVLGIPAQMGIDPGQELNEDTVEVSVDGEPVKLTPMEFKIVQLLIKNPGRVFSADEIYERIWNEKAVNTDTIMVHVRNIREKIEIDPKNPKYLKVVWGVGYKIDRQ